MARRLPKGKPFTVRLRTEDDRFIKDEARRLNRSRGTIAEGYASEAIRTRRFQGIAFRGGDDGRRAWVIGTGLDVWEIVALARQLGTEAELSAEYELGSGQIKVALDYQREFQQEIDELIARGCRSEEQLRSDYPFLKTFEEAAASRPL